METRGGESKNETKQKGFCWDCLCLWKKPKETAYVPVVSPEKKALFLGIFAQVATLAAHAEQRATIAEGNLVERIGRDKFEKLEKDMAAYETMPGPEPKEFTHDELKKVVGPHYEKRIEKINDHFKDTKPISMESREAGLTTHKTFHFEISPRQLDQYLQQVMHSAKSKGEDAKANATLGIQLSPLGRGRGGYARV